MNRWLLLMIGVAIIWGAAFPFTKPALAQVPPATFTMLRFLLVCLVLIPPALFAHYRRTRRLGFGIARGDWPRLIAAALIGYVVTQISQNWALSLSPSSDIALIAATQAVWIVVLGAIVLREAVSARGWLGLLCCLLGVALITGIGTSDTAVALDGARPGWQRVAGDAIFLLGSICWAVYNLLNRSLGRRSPPLGTVAAMSLVGLIALIPLAALEQFGGGRLPGVTAPPGLRPTGVLIGGVAYSALLVTVLGLIVLLVAYRHLSVSQVAVTFYVSPLTGVLVALAWLGEPLRAGLLLGIPLILLGVALTTSAGHQTAVTPRASNEDPRPDAAPSR